MNKIKNIIKYSYNRDIPKLNFEKYKLKDNNILYKNDKDIYYILDSCGLDAFAHFIFEGFIFIPILIELNKFNKNIKILTTNKKRYVINLLNFFKIPNKVVYEITNYNNICYYPNQYTICDYGKNIKDDEYYMKYFNDYINYIKNNIDNISNNNLLYLPRNTKDNFLPNDRIVNNTDKIKKIVIKKNGIVLDTYDLNNIKYQLSIVNNSNKIILDYGSSLYFNSIILEKKKIYMLDDEGFHDLNLRFPFFDFLSNYIKERNEVKIIKTNDYNIMNKL